jgi:hypothetical protein
MAIPQQIGSNLKDVGVRLTEPALAAGQLGEHLLGQVLGLRAVTKAPGEERYQRRTVALVKVDEVGLHFGSQVGHME